jgi:hypothetical protein
MSELGLLEQLQARLDSVEIPPGESGVISG